MSADSYRLPSPISCFGNYEQQSFVYVNCDGRNKRDLFTAWVSCWCLHLSRANRIFLVLMTSQISNREKEGYYGNQKGEMTGNAICFLYVSFCVPCCWCCLLLLTVLHNDTQRDMLRLPLWSKLSLSLCDVLLSPSISRIPYEYNIFFLLCMVSLGGSGVCAYLPYPGRHTSAYLLPKF